MRRSRRSPAEHGAAVVDFVLVSVVLVPLLLGLVQVGLVLHVRNTIASAAAEGARYAARLGVLPGAGAVRARELVGAAIGDRMVATVTAREVVRDGLRVVEVQVEVDVPPLGLMGPGVRLSATGHGVREATPG